MNHKLLYIGTSGYSYSSWKNFFYPPKLGTGKWFQFYCENFNTVELNNTFYRFPVKAHMTRLHELSPDNFIFSVKAHKIITHTLRMKNAKEKVDEYLDIVINGLKEKLANVLFQFPPSFKYSDENMSNILGTISNYEICVVEFRDASWWENKAPKQLIDNGITFCNMSHPLLPESNFSSANKYYLRMHGVPDLFKSSYSTEKLKSMADQIPSMAKKVFIYFNNTTFKGAFENAEWINNYLNKKYFSSSINSLQQN